jgi:hypothetical protein
MKRPSDDELRRWGASMREIDPDSLQQEPDGGTVRWFLGEAGTEAFVWSFPGQAAHHIQLVFCRVTVEWSTTGGLATGTFRNAATTAGGRYDPYLMTVGRDADPEVCQAANVLLSAISVPGAPLAPLASALGSPPVRLP